eukprot:Polyplicarium_translucidae@DN2337_c0_g1_i6.p1
MRSGASVLPSRSGCCLFWRRHACASAQPHSFSSSPTPHRTVSSSENFPAPNVQRDAVHSGLICRRQEGNGKGASLRTASHESALAGGMRFPAVSPARAASANRMVGESPCLAPRDAADRIARLSQRLSGLHAGLEAERTSRSEHLRGIVKATDERLLSVHEGNASRFDSMKEQIASLQTELRLNRDARDAFLADMQREVTDIDSRVTQAMETDRQDRLEFENRIFAVFDEKTKALRDEVAQEEAAKADNESLVAKFVDENAQISTALQFEQQQRDTAEQRVFDRAAGEINRLHKAIAEERAAREETEETLLMMFRSVVDRQQQQLDEERRERAAVEERMLSLLEETCMRLSAASQF